MWSAPYLYASRVAVCPDAQRNLGVPGTFAEGIAPDPANSLRALTAYLFSVARVQEPVATP